MIWWRSFLLGVVFGAGALMAVARIAYALEMKEAKRGERRGR